MYYGYYGYYFDPTYFLILIAIAISGIASMKMKSTFLKYTRVSSRLGLTGAETAKRILESQGIYDVQVVHVAGELTDHYDPRTRTVNLSDPVYASTSIAAVGVAAHECGHAVQDAVGYVPLQVRGAMVPVVNIGSSLSWPMILIGIFLSQGRLISLGIVLFSFSVIFQLVTLPVEFNASHRALRLLESTGILIRDEVNDTRKVLTAAALTYVAATIGSLLQLLRLLILFGGRRRDD
ncbi:zinc metallopeptidase [[Clostridium] aminophilum]|uniref:zinc metallopeptidase n=1 Tax=[Clostridium] aminophilum TaxID=1526 RepID=UPI0026F14745|nr:zinc metallopeptidase [[Clostridium] aminophilum]MDD6197211.1 zinc metallopeptidase [[Clostridium] aminophilum]